MVRRGGLVFFNVLKWSGGGFLWERGGVVDFVGDAGIWLGAREHGLF